MSAFGAKTLAELRNVVRLRVDMPLGDLNGVPREIVGDAELNGYINASRQEFHDILIGHYGEDYFVADPFAIVTDGLNETFDLPFDFFKELGLDLQLPGSPQRWIRINSFNFAERNRYTWPAAGGGMFPPLAANLHSRIRDNKLWLKPLPPGGMQLQLYYVPLPAILADKGTIDVQNCAVGDTLILNGTKYTFVVSGSAPTGSVTVLLGATGIARANNLAIAIGLHDDSVNGTASGTILTVVPSIGYEDKQIIWAGTFGFVMMPGSGAWSYRTDSKETQWIEYFVCDASIKCKAKQEDDVSLEMAQKAALLDRVENMARHRSSGPQRVVDVQGSDYPFGSGWGNGGW